MREIGAMTDSILLNEDFWAEASNSLSAEEYFDNKEMWNKKASEFSQKKAKTAYTIQFLDLLKISPGESVFDMGAGWGALSIPLAEAGHKVYAVDFSPAMIAELTRRAHEAEVDIDCYECSWQNDWTHLPQADVVIASRSFATIDIKNSIAKLESKAHKSVVLTLAINEAPWQDTRIRSALGETAPSNDRDKPRSSFVALINYLFAIGREPSVNYIRYTRKWSSPNKESLRQSIHTMFCKEGEDMPESLTTFLDEHTIYNDQKDCYELDYEQEVVWGYLSWSV